MEGVRIIFLPELRILAELNRHSVQFLDFLL
jgi:hypothetical protein